MLRHFIILFGILHAIVMASVTTWSSLQVSILRQGHLFEEPWFIATLLDAYLAFLLFYLWLVLTEHGMLRKIIYFFLIVSLGNIAMGLIVSWRAYRLSHRLTWSQFFIGNNHG